MKLLMTNKTTLQTIRVDSPTAARIIGSDPDHLAWALENYNRCDVDEWVVITEDYDSDNPTGE